MTGMVRAEILEQIPENLFREPVEFILADHYRQRQVCDLLEDIACHAAPESERAAAALVLDYLERELPLHVADEEKDLFPRLRQRALPEDSVPDLLRLLGGEHARDETLARGLLAALRRIADGQPLNDPGTFRRLAGTFGETHRRHIAWENAFLLPLARRRLRPADMVDLGRAMAARRGIAYPD